MIEALLGGAGILSTLTLAIWALTAERRAGEQGKRAAVFERDLATQKANTAAEKKRADYQERRANALDAAIVLAAARPIDGSFELLKAREAANAAAADGDGAGELRDTGAASEPAETLGPDGLFHPFGT